MIRDLEEQLLRVPRREAREQMAEAVRCYHAEAYRASIVMAFAAGMDDLRCKILDVAASGGAPQSVRDAAKRIDEIFKAQQSFEDEAIIAADKHAQLISPDDAKALQSYLKLRHLCAHPSGYVATAEEARAVISRIIESILSRPATMGMVLVTELLHRLCSEHFFPEKGIDAVAKTMTHELALLAPPLFPALISRLVEALRESGSSTTMRALRPPLYHNSLGALGGLAVHPQARDIFWSSKAVQELVLSPAEPLDALRLLAVSPSAFGSLDDITRGRLVLVAQRNLASPTVRRLLRELGNFLRAKEREEFVQALRRDFVEHLSPKSGKSLEEVGWPDLESDLISQIVEHINVGGYSEANKAILAADGLLPIQASRMTPAQCTQYLFALARKAEGDYPSFEARDRRAEGLGARVDLVDGLVDDAIRTEGDSLVFGEPHLHGLFEILLASKRPDAVAALIRHLTLAMRMLPDRAKEVASKAGQADIDAAIGDSLPF